MEPSIVNALRKNKVKNTALKSTPKQNVNEVSMYAKGDCEPFFILTVVIVEVINSSIPEKSTIESTEI